MDTLPFIESFREINDSFVKLIGSLSALRGLSTLRVYGQAERQLLDSALDVLMHNQDLERCSVYLLQEGRLLNAAGLDWADLLAMHPPLEERPRPQCESFAVGEGLVGLTAQTGVLQHSRNCHKDPRFLTDCTEDKVGEVRIGSIISVPIKASGELLGVLNVSHPHTEFFNEAHERALFIFANFLGQMLLNNRMLGDMERLVRERTQQLEQTLADAETLKRRYAELSVIDELTGLHNRRFFFPEARAAMARSLRYKRGYCVMLLDLDHFKQINDGYGHRVGDEVLKRSAALLKQQCREVDVLARFGGEEFVLALPDTELDGALQLAERIRDEVERASWQINGHTVSTQTITIGISCLPESEHGDAQQVLERLINEADKALYYGKHNGRNQCVAYATLAQKT